MQKKHGNRYVLLLEKDTVHLSISYPLASLVF